MSIRWPEYYRPEQTAVHVSNTIDVDAPIDVVWAWLIRADLWSTYYSNAKNLSFLNQKDDPNLKLGTRFRWTTFGVTIDSDVIEYVLNERISWTGARMGLDVVHAWLLTPKTDANGVVTGTHILTEETQNGALARLSKWIYPKRMHDEHQHWLEGIAERANTGMPPPPNDASTTSTAAPTDSTDAASTSTSKSDQATAVAESNRQK